jgi:multidrug transporter EmrE-like cation transporter
VGIFAFKEPANVARIFLIVALIGAIVGLKMVSE